jgi:hypothetical protein
MVLENLPFIIFVIFSITIFIGCILLVDKIFALTGYTNNKTGYSDQNK